MAEQTPAPLQAPAVTSARVASQVASIDNPANAADSKLVDVNGVGPAVFGVNAPSVRTLRTLTRRGLLPYFRIGKLIYYDPRLVRAALELQCLVQAKKARTA